MKYRNDDRRWRRWTQMKGLSTTTSMERIRQSVPKLFTQREAYPSEEAVEVLAVAGVSGRATALSFFSAPSAVSWL